MKPPSKAKIEALEALVKESGALWQRMRVVAEQAHPEGKVTTAMRGVMATLADGGPQTVPQLARVRPVSRQHIQMLVNRLLEEKLVEMTDNPAHRRSRLVQLTEKGKRSLSEMRQRQWELMAHLPVRTSKKELRAAAETLRSARSLFEGEKWQKLVRP